MGIITYVTRGRSGWERLSEGHVEGFAGVERHAPGVGPLELLPAEVGTHLVEAVLAVVRFKFLPRLPDWVEGALRDAVEHGCLVPVARVRGEACQAEAGVSNTGTVPVVAAYSQGRGEAGSRAAGVVVLAKYPAHVDRQVEDFSPDGLYSLGCLLQISPGGGDVSGAQRLNASAIVREVGEEMVA